MLQIIAGCVDRSHLDRLIGKSLLGGVCYVPKQDPNFVVSWRGVIIKSVDHVNSGRIFVFNQLA